MLSKWSAAMSLIGLLVLTSQNVVLADRRGADAYYNEDESGGGGGAYTVVYGRPQKAGSIAIKADMEIEEVPMRFYGRQPFADDKEDVVEPSHGGGVYHADSRGYDKPAFYDGDDFASDSKYYYRRTSKYPKRTHSRRSKSIGKNQALTSEIYSRRSNISPLASDAENMNSQYLEQNVPKVDKLVKVKEMIEPMHFLVDLFGNWQHPPSSAQEERYDRENSIESNMITPLLFTKNGVTPKSAAMTIGQPFVPEGSNSHYFPFIAKDGLYGVLVPADEFGMSPTTRWPMSDVE